MNIKTINQLEETNVLDGFYGIACDGNNETKKYKLPSLMAGEGNNSVMLDGGNNQVISESSIALGKNNVVGLKGWYYDSIYKKTNSQIYVYLSKTQKVLPLTDEELKTSEQSPDTSLPNLYELLGNETSVSLVNDSKYDNAFILVGGGNGYVILNTADGSDIPFTSIKYELLNDPEDYSIYCLSQPDKGMFDMGQGSTAGGYNNRATNGKATSFGFGNNAYGKFSFAEGRENEAGYAAHAEGRENIAKGNTSHAEGYLTSAFANQSHSEGWRTKVDIDARAGHAEGYNTVVGGEETALTAGSDTSNGVYSHAEGNATQAIGYNSHSEGRLTKTLGNVSHAEGNQTRTKGSNSHAEGLLTFAEGYTSHAEGSSTHAYGSNSHAEGQNTYAGANRSHAEGYGTKALNMSEHAEGKYNKSNTNTLHSVGIGTSDTARKNAHEIMQDGNHYIYGIGGYDGTNAVTANAQGIIAKSVQDVINEILSKIG